MAFTIKYHTIERHIFCSSVQLKATRRTSAYAPDVAVRKY